MSEAALQRVILQALTQCGCVVWKNQSGMARGRVGRIHMAPKGSPDIVGFTRFGRFLGIEVKLPGGRLSDEQQEWLERMTAAGCLCGVARSVEDALAIAEVGR